MIATPPFVSPFNDEQSPRQDAFQPLQTEDMSNEVSSPRVSISEEQYFSLLKRHLSTLKESRLMMETAHSHRISLLNDQLSTLDTSIAELEREEHDLKEVVSIAKQDEEEDEAFKQKQLERKTELTKAIERNNADIAQIAKLLQQTVSKLNSLKETNSKQDPKPKMPEPEVPSRERTFFTVADVDGTFDEEDSETVQDVPRTKTLASTVSLDERPSYVSLLQKRMGTPLRGGNVTKEREPTLGRRRSVEDAQANPLSSTQKNSTMKPRRSRSPPVTPSTSKIGRRATPEPKTTLKPPEESLLIDVPSALAGTVSDLPQLSNSPTKSVSFVIPSASSLRLFQRSQSVSPRKEHRPLLTPHVSRKEPTSFNQTSSHQDRKRQPQFRHSDTPLASTLHSQPRRIRLEETPSSLPTREKEEQSFQRGQGRSKPIINHTSQITDDSEVPSVLSSSYQHINVHYTNKSQRRTERRPAQTADNTHDESASNSRGILRRAKR